MTDSVNPNIKSLSYRNDIQGLRAIAVGLVILGHAEIARFAGGFIGVDVFFVISGFVITQMILRQTGDTVIENIRHFYIRRILRIVPAATLVLIVTVLVAYRLLADYFDPQLLIDTRWASLFAANWEMIRTSSDYFSTGIPPSLVTHYWSLAVEEQFYFVYPLIMFTILRLIPKDRRNVILPAFLVLVIVASGIWGVHAHSINPVAAYYSPFTRFWELGLGGLIALPRTWTLKVNNIAKSVIAIMALAVIVGSAMTFDALTMNLSLWMWLPVVATGALLLTGSDSSSGRLLGMQPLRYIGNISFALYLWHFIWLKLPLQMPFEELPNNLVPIGIAGTFASAVLSYHLMENPIRRSKKLASNGWAVLALLIACIAMTWITAGWVEHLYNSIIW